MIYIQKGFTGQRAIFLQTIVVLLAALLWSGCSKEEKVEKVAVVRPVKIMIIQTGTAVFSHNLPGKVRAAKRSELSFKVSGPLVSLPVDEGQQVKKGDLIAQIQKRDFQTALDETRARKLEAEKQFHRYKELYARKQVSRADYDRYRAARDVAGAQLEDARNALKDTSLLAPFAGVIAKRFVENYQKVQAKEPIVNLQDITQIEILVDVPELQMAGLKNQKKSQILASFESIPGKKFPLTIKEFSTQADPATQTYQIVLIMDQPDEAMLLPGMTATVTTEMSESDGMSRALLVPAIAVLDAAGNQAFVWVLDTEQSVVHKRSVSVGQLEGSKNIFIQDGLKDGETIIIAGINQLKEGMKVRPWKEQREGR